MRTVITVHGLEIPPKNLESSKIFNEYVSKRIPVYSWYLYINSFPSYMRFEDNMIFDFLQAWHKRLGRK